MMHKCNKAFTLVELLAVIIILGVLLIIAIPSVTKYIEDSRKEVYVQSANGYVESVKAMITSREISTKRKDTTYYIPIDLIKLENGGDSPYGNWLEAYVVVIYEDSEYQYFWTSIDDTGHKIELKNIENITTADIIIDSTKTLNNSISIGSRDKIYTLKEDGTFDEKAPLNYY